MGESKPVISLVGRHLTGPQDDCLTIRAATYWDERRRVAVGLSLKLPDGGTLLACFTPGTES